MATTTTTVRQEIELCLPDPPAGDGYYLRAASALSIWWLFARTVEPGVITKFGMTPGGSEATIPDLVTAHPVSR